MNLNKMKYTSTSPEQKHLCETLNYYVKELEFLFSGSQS